MQRTDEGPRGPAESARPTDAVLVAAALSGVSWAREALFRRHAGWALGLARRLLGHDAEVDDIVQDAYFRAFKHLARLHDPEAFRAWLSGIIVRCVQSLLRRRALLRRLGLAPRDASEPDMVLSSGCPADVARELAEVYAVLDSLASQARLVLLLRRVEGYSLVEIAALLQCSLSTVKRRLGDAEHVLRAHRKDDA